MSFVQEYSTRVASVVRTVVLSVIEIPVYIRTVVPMRVLVRLPETPDAQAAMSSEMLLSLAGGGAAVLAILAGIAIFIVRRGTQDDSGAPDTIEPTTNPQEFTIEASMRVCEVPSREFREAPPPSLSERVRNRWGSRDHSSGSGSLSSADVELTEDPGLYI
jgi:hypothetical protein